MNPSTKSSGTQRRGRARVPATSLPLETAAEKVVRVSSIGPGRLAIRLCDGSGQPCEYFPRIMCAPGDSRSPFGATGQDPRPTLRAVGQASRVPPSQVSLWCRGPSDSKAPLAFQVGTSDQITHSCKLNARSRDRAPPLIQPTADDLKSRSGTAAQVINPRPPFPQRAC